jgi:cytochrome b pre-mRNA-processing protein 3
MARNVYSAEQPEDGRALAAYALATRDRLAAQPFDAVLAGPEWAEINR